MKRTWREGESWEKMKRIQFVSEQFRIIIRINDVGHIVFRVPDDKVITWS